MSQTTLPLLYNFLAHIPFPLHLSSSPLLPFSLSSLTLISLSLSSPHRPILQPISFHDIPPLTLNHHCLPFFTSFHAVISSRSLSPLSPKLFPLPFPHYHLPFSVFSLPLLLPSLFFFPFCFLLISDITSSPYFPPFLRASFTVLIFILPSVFSFFISPPSSVLFFPSFSAIFLAYPLPFFASFTAIVSFLF